MEIKIKWIPRKQMTHENTYRDDMSCFRIIHFILISSARVIFDVFSRFYFWNVNRTPTWHLSKMFKVAFKDVSTKNSEPIYLAILFVMLKIYFIYKVVGKNPEGLYKIELCRLPLRHRLFLSCDCHGVTIVLVNKRADWNVPVSYIKYMSLCSALWFQHWKNHQK